MTKNQVIEVFEKAAVLIFNGRQHFSCIAVSQLEYPFMKSDDFVTDNGARIIYKKLMRPSVLQMEGIPYKRAALARTLSLLLAAEIVRDQGLLK